MKVKGLYISFGLGLVVGGLTVIQIFTNWPWYPAVIIGLVVILVGSIVSFVRNRDAERAIRR